MTSRSLAPIALLVAGWGFPGGAAEPPKSREVTFAQLTGAHIFDDGWKKPTPNAMRQAANNRTALDWAIRQINLAVASGTKIDFVVYTGDLGLQNVSFVEDSACRALKLKLEPGLPPSLD